MLYCFNVYMFNLYIKCIMKCFAACYGLNFICICQSFTLYGCKPTDHFIKAMIMVCTVRYKTTSPHTFEVMGAVALFMMMNSALTKVHSERRGRVLVCAPE